MHYMNHEHSQRDKIVRLNGLGSPKVRGLGQLKGFGWFCIKLGKLEGIGDFSLEKLVNHLLQEELLHFTIKNYNFCLLEKVLCGMFECDKMNNVEGELFRFQLCFINCESVLTF